MKQSNSGVPLLKAMVVSISALVTSGVAHAQSSVTLYGVVDAGLLYLSKTQDATGGNGGRLFGFTDSGQTLSRFGLRGSEDLGGGLYAIFQLESGIDVGNGGFNDSNGNLFGRQAWVGLQGNFGEVRAGLQFSPFFLTSVMLDPRGLSQFGSMISVYLNNASATGIFNPNGLSYSSPTIGGLQGSVMFAPGGVAGDFQAGRQYSANLSYHWKGLGILAAYYNGNPGGAVSTVPPTTLGFQGRMIGATYEFGGLTAKASFTNYKMAGSGLDNDVYGAGLEYTVTPALSLNGGVWYMVNRNDTSSKSLMGAVGTSYQLSKRTGLYAQVGVVNNKGTQNLGLAAGDAPTSLYAPAGTTVGADVGIRHSF